MSPSRNARIPRSDHEWSREPIVMRSFREKFREITALWPRARARSSERQRKDASGLPTSKPDDLCLRPLKEKSAGMAVSVFPGGGTGIWRGTWKRKIGSVVERVGVTAVVLKYRVPRRAGQPELLPAPGRCWMRSERQPGSKSRRRSGESIPLASASLVSRRAGTWPSPQPRTSTNAVTSRWMLSTR